MKTSLKGHFWTVARSFRCLEKQNNIFKGHYSGVNNYNNFDNKHDNNNNININGNKCILFIALYAKVALKKSDRKSEDEKNESIGWILAASGK